MEKIDNVKTIFDPLFTWHPPQRLPILKTDQDPNRKMMLELEDGYHCTGEFEHATGKFLAYLQRLDTTVIPQDIDLINDSLEWVLEEVDNIRFWIWLPRPSLT